MYHTAYVSTWLNSPHGRSAVAYNVQAPTWVRADVFLPFDANDFGSYPVWSVHEFYCDVGSSFVPAGETEEDTELQPPTLVCGITARGQTSACTLIDLNGIWNASEWKFIDGALVTNRTPASSSKTWSGTAVKSGTVRVRAQGPDTRYPEGQLIVSARNWHTNPANPAQVPNGTFYTLPVPPQPSGSDSGLGKYQELTSNTSFNYTTIGSGPNQGYSYFATLPITTLFRYEINPDLENSNSVFSLNQWVNCGFISWSNLLTQTRRHEYNSTTQSHHALYKNSINSGAKNPETSFSNKWRPRVRIWRSSRAG